MTRKPALQSGSGRALAAGVAGLSPAAFGLVMATGIVAVAADGLGYFRLAAWLFYLNAGQYGLLWLLYALRAGCWPQQFFGDFTSHRDGPGYFTAVAATGIIASQCLGGRGPLWVGAALWLLTLLLWLGLTYAIFPALIVGRSKPPWRQGINGGWLLAVVATQAVAVASIWLAPLVAAGWQLPLDLLALSTWLCGVMLYIWLMTLIFYRHVFFGVRPDALTPPLWISMGAMAISTLAGSLLVVRAPAAPFLFALLPFLKGVTLLCWATAAWWTPLLLLLTLWRHAVRRVPLRYDPLVWGMVFPLGMLAACTGHLGHAMGLAFLADGAAAIFHVALLVWAVCYAAMLGHLARAARRG